jgi:hypothetical protein
MAIDKITTITTTYQQQYKVMDQLIQSRLLSLLFILHSELPDEYYSFIHAWFIHRFLRENILVIHSSCARIIHLFTLGGNAYSLPSKEGEYQSISLQSTTSKLQIK